MDVTVYAPFFTVSGMIISPLGADSYPLTAHVVPLVGIYRRLPSAKDPAGGSADWAWTTVIAVPASSAAV